MAVGLVAVAAPAHAATPEAYDVYAEGVVNEVTTVYLDVYDEDGDELTVAIVDQPDHGTLAPCGPDMACDYTPDTGFVGTDRFVYSVSDGTSASPPATATIVITDPDAPVAFDNNAVTVVGVDQVISLSGYDPAGGTLTFSIVSPPDSGSLGPIGSPTCDSGSCTSEVTYTPGAAAGEVSFTYRATAADGRTSWPATVTIYVQEPAAPTAADTWVEVQTDAVSVVTISGEDQLDEDLTFAILDEPEHGALTPAGPPSCDRGSCTADYEFDADAYLGADSFTFEVSNGSLTSEPATVSVDIVAAPCLGDTITNGTVLLGINCRGELVVTDEESGDDKGIEYVPTTNDSISPGCACEGWGVADETTEVSGYANQSAGTSNVDIVSFVADADSAVSATKIGDTFEVTHDFHPAAETPNLYEVAVSVKNISSAPTELRYRRAWTGTSNPRPSASS